MTKAKVRGMKRKCRDMVVRIEKETQTFPHAHRGLGYWHLHLPVAHNFINSKATPLSVKRSCAQTLIHQAHHLAQIAPYNEKTRVVVAVNLPDFWQSQIIIFFGEDYFRTFFDRQTEAQRWAPFENTSLSGRWNLVLPAGLSERGYRETRSEDGNLYSGQIWFIGQLD